MNQSDFAGYLGLCTPDFSYRITSYSPELRKDMVWKDLGRQEFARHLEVVPKHVADPSPFTRMPMVYFINYSDDGKQAVAVSGIQIFKTGLDGGATQLWGIGMLHDVIELGTTQPRLLRREVRMETRNLGTGSQIPV
jgi:methanesulfonate monooxygenase small subunit